jgi:hypothetical protein
VKVSLVRQGAFYIGVKRQRIREVMVAHVVWIDWRDVDPETVDFVSWLGVEKGQCAPRTFAAWAKREVSPEEVKARLAMPRSERIKLSAAETILT